MHQTSIKTKFGWISAYEEKGNIVKVKFGKCKNGSKSSNLNKFKSFIKNFCAKKNKKIRLKFLIT